MQIGSAARTCTALCAGAIVAFASPAAADDRPLAWVTDEGTRVRRDEIGTASRGQESSLWKPGGPVALSALADETVALQVIVEAGGEDLGGVTIEIAPFTRPQGGGSSPTASRFIEHYVEVKGRSRNEREPAESLGWTPAGRPPDGPMLGWVPDALVPVELAPSWAPYPLRVVARSNGAVWIDVTVPADAAAGRYESRIVASSSSHGPIGVFPVTLEVAAARLPYRPVSFLIYYDANALEERTGDKRAPDADELSATEIDLWQLLHAHHADALPSGLVSAKAARRLAPALDGSLFTPARGYGGPGLGVAPAAVAIGAYGELHDATPESLARVKEVVPLIPSAVEDVFLYAVDEKCKSPRGPSWRRLLRSEPELARVRVGHTCSEDPRQQDVDLVMMGSSSFVTDPAEDARRAGRLVWVYNALLPRSGPGLLDSALTSFTADGWIAASYPVGRWFLWESIFWTDENQGGRGPIDPFVIAESFHNADGDACLFDGLLIYPGTQVPPFAAHSLGFRGVLPSMRLKSLRRGIEDAGLFALARAVAPEAADRIMAETMPRALEDAALDEPTPWRTEGRAFAEARAALRRLVAGGSPSLSPERAREMLAAAAAVRRSARPLLRLSGRGRTWTIAAMALALVAVGIGLGLTARARRRLRP